MNADFEVKKLKDLVKKLELQNQHLRYKTGKLGPSSHTRPRHDPVSSESDDLAYGSSDDSALIDPRFKETQKSDPTCWLYAWKADCTYEDPYVLKSWLRHELDHPPTQQLEFARRDIISTLKAEENLAVSEDLDKSLPEVETIPIRPKSHPKRREMVPSVEDDYIKQPIHDFIEEEKSYAPSPVHHMPLPSHTMTSKYGLVDASGKEYHSTHHRMRSPSRRSASPSNVQRSRGMSPSRASQAPAYQGRSHRSPTRRGQSPSRNTPTTVSSRGHSPSRNGPTEINSLGQSTVNSRGQSPLRNISAAVSSRGQSPSRNGSTSINSRGQSPSRSSATAVSSRGQSPSRNNSATVSSRGLSPLRNIDPATNLDVAHSKNTHDSTVGTPRRYRSPSPTGRTGFVQPSTGGLFTKSNRTGTTSTSNYSESSSRTPRSSNIKPPLSGSRLRLPRSTKPTGIRTSLRQSDVKHAASTEELAHTMEERGLVQPSKVPKSSVRRSLPRPSHSSGISSPQYLSSPRNRFGGRDSPSWAASSPRESLSPKSDVVKSDPSDVWTDGEFF